MPYDIGTQPANIALPAYRGAGVNDGGTKDLAALFQASRKPLLLTFVNAASRSALEWLALVPAIAGAACNAFVVVFKHDGAAFQPCSADADAAPAVRSLPGGRGDEVFANIPVVADGEGSVAKAYLAQIPFPPTNRDTWSYLVDSAFLICDKWHTSALAPGFPISFKHIQLAPDPGPFHGGQFEIAKAYVRKRIEYLNAPLAILSAKPLPGTLLHSSSEIRKVFFSKPLLDATVTADKFLLGGSGVLGTAGKAATVNYAGYEKAENGVLVNFPVSAVLKHAGPDSVTLTVANGELGVLDTNRGTLSGANTLKFATEEGAMPQPAFVPTPIRDLGKKPTAPDQAGKPAGREGGGGLARPEPRKPTQEPAGRGLRPAAKKPVKKTVKKPAQKAVAKKKPVKKAVAKKPAKKVVVAKKPVKKAVKKSVKKAAAAKKPAKKAIAKKPIKKAVAKKKPVKKTAAKKAAPAKAKKPVAKKAKAPKAKAKKPAKKKTAKKK